MWSRQVIYFSSFLVSGGAVLPASSATVAKQLDKAPPLLQNLKCHGVGITATLYPSSSHRSSNEPEDCEINTTIIIIIIFILIVKKALYNINRCIEAGSPLETLRSLQKPPANLPFPYLEAEDYQLALEQEKREGFPSNTIVNL